MTNLNDFATNFFNIQLAFFGISITVFTVFFAFILSKRDELKLINYQIEKGDNSPSLKQKRSFIINNIKKLTSINLFTLKVVISTFIFFIISFIISNTNFNKSLSNIILYALYIILAFEIIVFAILIFRLLKYYNKSIKI
jgi:hypothetical protein